jgi:nucleotide-binding universal stress UspA family protein
LVKDQVKQKGFKNEIKLTLKTKEGSPADMILQTVEEENIDLVVMGASGKHALEGLYWVV